MSVPGTRYRFQVLVKDAAVRAKAAEIIRARRGDAHAAAFLSPTWDCVFVQEAAAAQQLLQLLRVEAADIPVGFDFETAGWSPEMEQHGFFDKDLVGKFNPMSGTCAVTPVTFQLYWTGTTIYVVAGHLLPLFARWLRDEALLDVANWAFEATVMARAGFPIHRVHRDPLSMDFLWAETTRQWKHDLKSVAEDVLGVKTRSFQELFGKYAKGTDQTRIFEVALKSDPTTAMEYAGFDPWMTVFASDVREAELAARPARPRYDSEELYRHWERPYMTALARMQMAGVPLNLVQLTKMSLGLSRAQTEAEGEAYKARGQVFNLASPLQLRTYFYEEKKYPVVETGDSHHCVLCRKDINASTDNLCRVHGAGALVNVPKVDETALERFAAMGDPLAQRIKTFRGVSKELSTWVVPLGRYAQLEFDGEGGCRVVGYPSLNGTHVVSGRLEGGVWLTFPRDKRFRALVGFWESLKEKLTPDELEKLIGFLKRKFSLSDDQVWEALGDLQDEVLAGDYSQIELRLLAHASKDPVLLDAFANGRDMHAWTAALVVAFLRHGPSATQEQRLGAYEEIVLAKTKDENHEKLSVVEAELLEWRQKGKCFHPDTEVLTRRGWVRILELHPDEEVVAAFPGAGVEAVRLGWQVPLQVTRLAHPSGKLHLMAGRGFETGVSPDHRTLWRREGEDRYRTTPAEEVERNAHIPSSGHLLQGARRVDGVMLRVAVALQADGFYSGDNVSFEFAKTRKIDRLRELLTAANLSFNETRIKGDTKTLFTVYSAGADELRDLLDYPEKKFPWWWLDLSYDLRGAVLDEIGYWDCETTAAGWRYTSKHRQNVDVAQALAASTGRRTWLAQDRDWWRLTINKSGADHVLERAFEAEFMDELACLSVPSTYVLTRFRGSVQVIGQTLNFALVYGAGVEKLADGMGVTVAEATDIVGAVRKVYQGLEAWKVKHIQGIVDDGCVMTTIGGRKRVILELASTNPEIRAIGERLAVNQVCQAGGGDVIRGAMIQLDMDYEAGGGYGTEGRMAYGAWVDGTYQIDPSRIPKAWGQKLPPALAADFGWLGLHKVRMVLQVHDELMSIARKIFSELAKKRIKAIMADPFGDDLLLDCPIKVGMNSGPTWAEAK